MSSLVEGEDSNNFLKLKMNKIKIKRDPRFVLRILVWVELLLGQCVLANVWQDFLKIVKWNYQIPKEYNLKENYKTLEELRNEDIIKKIDSSYKIFKLWKEILSLKVLRQF